MSESFKPSHTGTIKRILLALLVLAGCYQKPVAQDVEAGAWLGVANYIGDLNPVHSLKEVRWAGGAIYRYNINPRMALRVGVSYGRVKASDSKISRLPYPEVRNLSFESDVLEAGGAFEINFFKYQPVKGHIFSPYLMIGMSMFYFNPFTHMEGNKIFLQQVGTEGQHTLFGEDNAYARYSFAIPFGGGLKYALNNNWSLNVELSSRITFTDYLDDVGNAYMDPEYLGSVNAAIADRSDDGMVTGKQRGTAKDRDRFNLLGIGLTYSIRKTKCPDISNRQF